MEDWRPREAKRSPSSRIHKVAFWASVAVVGALFAIDVLPEAIGSVWPGVMAFHDTSVRHMEDEKIQGKLTTANQKTDYYRAKYLSDEAVIVALTEGTHIAKR